MTKLPISSLLVAAAMAAPIFAQATSRVVPASNETVVGNSSAIRPFGYTAFRAQQIYDASTIAQTSASITAMALRSDGATGTATSVDNVTINLSQTTFAPQNMNTSFAANITGTPITVYSGSVNLPAQSAVPFGPLPFTVFIPFSTPFPFQTAQGNLLVDITANNATPATRIPYTVDAALPGGTVEIFGQNGTGIDNLNFSAYGAGGASSRTSIVPGGGIELTTSVAQWAPDFVGAHVVGLFPQANPIDLTPLGAPGNSVYVDNIVATLPHSWQTNFIAKVSVSPIALPANPAIVDAAIYAQSVMLEPSANAFGLVTTEALRVVVGDANDEIMQLLTSQDPADAQGSYYFGANDRGGMVTQFHGTFN